MGDVAIYGNGDINLNLVMGLIHESKNTEAIGWKNGVQIPSGYVLTVGGGVVVSISSETLDESPDDYISTLSTSESSEGIR